MRVGDAAGNVSAKVERVITVDNTPPIYTSTVSVHVGTGVETPPSPPSGAGAPPPPGFPGTLAALTCQAPRLSVTLSRKPLRRLRNGVPVLRAGKAYRFSGRLTCRSGTRRVNAPRGIPIELYHNVGRRLIRKPFGKTALHGRVAFNLRLYGKRVLVFRVRGSRRELVQVRIRVAVVRKR